VGSGVTGVTSVMTHDALEMGHRHISQNLKFKTSNKQPNYSKM